MRLERLASLVVLALVGCASFDPLPVDEVPFRERARTRSGRELTVTAAVPTRAEAEALYGVDLAARGIQPVWVQIENEGSEPVWFLPIAVDNHYFAPGEAAYAFHRGASSRADEMNRHFDALAFENPVPAGGTVSGFVLVNLDEGYKAIDVDVVREGDAQSFAFVFVDPTFRADFKRVDLDALWPADELVRVDDEDALRAALESLPTRTTNRAESKHGDPLNLVAIGERSEIFAALVRRGWHATETISWGSIWRTVKSFLGGSRYRYSPISPLYVYGRHQDFSAQRARGSIHERNHLRFWLTPIRFRGREVWVGQISRDIGVKFTTRSPTISTHVIDPDVDEARRHFLEDMAYSQSVAAVAFALGIGPISADEPRTNLVGDPYFTDGNRLVLFFEPRPRSLEEIDFLNWRVSVHGEDEP